VSHAWIRDESYMRKLESCMQKCKNKLQPTKICC